MSFYYNKKLHIIKYKKKSYSVLAFLILRFVV